MRPARARETPVDRRLDSHPAVSHRAAVESGDVRVDFGPLADLAGFMLRIAQVQLYEAYFAEFEADGITPGAIGILATVSKNPGVRQGVLADALRIKWSNMAKIIRSLGNRGLVERRVPASDRRALELRLTAAGRDVVDRMLPAIRRNDRAATAALTASERATLMRLLRKVTIGVPGPRA